MADLNALLNKQLGIEDPSDPTNTIDAEDNSQISTLESVLAGIGSGVIKMFEGPVTLVATLIDLGADTKKAVEVEKWFADINPWDEAAEATTAGKLTEIITSIGIPVGAAWNIGSKLAMGAIGAAKTGKYLNLVGKQKVAQNIAKGVKAERGLTAADLTGRGKAIRIGSAMGASGLVEGAVVSDVEEIGTFGDLLGGPTQIERPEEYTPESELVNRLKFGVEGMAFSGLLSAAGQTIKMLRNQKNSGQVVEGKWKKFLDEWISRPLRARGRKTQEYFEAENLLTGEISADRNAAQNAAYEIDKQIDKLFRWWKNIGDRGAKKDRTRILKEMNDALLSGSGPNKTLKPVYDQVDVLTEQGRRDKFTLDEVLKDPALKEKYTKKGFRVGFGGMDETKEKILRQSLKDKKATPEQINAIIDSLYGMRSRWGTLFSSMGRRLNKEGLQNFRKIMDEKVTQWMDSSYEVFKNNPIRLADNYGPSKAIINETAKQFKKIAENKGFNISDLEAEKMVNEVWQTATLPRGFKLNEASDVMFTLPRFFVDKSFSKEIIEYNHKTTLGESGLAKPLIEKLLGKNENAMATILEGTNRLSTVVRKNEFYDNLINKSNEMLAQGKTPLVVDNPGLARKYLGGTGSDWRMIGKKQVDGEKARVAGMEAIDPYYDPKKKLAPLMDEVQPTKVVKGKIRELPIINPLEGKWALNGVVDALEGVDQSVMGKDFGSQLYQNFVLYPKATSQMAKTILAPFTHARNFLSASMFSVANGILPFGDKEAVRQAWNALQVAGPGTRKSNEFYQKLLRLGVVNSQVQLGDLQRLLKDVDFGATVNSIRGFNGFIKRLSKVKQFAQDAYTAEDDFWKIFTWFGEKGRLYNSYRNAGLQLGQEFVDVAGNKVRFTEDWLEKEAANLVKNQVPNYAFVSEFIKGLRRWPVGNFVSFPAEIMRTSTNIVSRALDEIFYTTKIGKNEAATPLRSIGLRRLAGMGIVTTAAPLAAVEGGKALYNVSQDELNAMRRYVADWAKNSTLIPLRDKDGNLEYIDFSHMNAYDTVSRPIQTVLNAVQEGRQDKDGIMDDFLIGLAESTKELAAPFISESIYTEAMQDVLPILGRRGRTADGREIYNPDWNIDPLGTQVAKSLAHVAKSQYPLNWEQMKRIGLAIKPIDDKGRFDPYGREYELGNELQGIVGMRSVKVDPVKSLGFKIKDYKDGIRASRNLFTRATLKGGPLTPEDIVDAYITANQALYRVNREMYQDIEAAKTLGTGEDTIGEIMRARGERRAFGALNEGRFRPLTISREIAGLFEQRFAKLGMSNSFEIAQDVLGAIRERLENSTLAFDAFPEIENPFRSVPQVDPIPQVNNILPPLPNPNLATGTQFGGNVLTGVNEADRFAALFPGDELGKLAANKKQPTRTI